jgi:polygalacturonase
MTTRRQFIAAAAAVAGGALPLPRTLRSAPPGGAEAGDAEVEAILARLRAPRFPDRRFPVTAFGAVGDGVADCRPAFARAIALCNAADGGRVVVPRGTWLVNGPVHLKSNVELHLEAGATVRFSATPEHYLPMVLTRWEGTECYNYSPLVYAYQATNVAITGAGTLDGNGKALFAGWRQRQEADVDRLRQMGIDGTPLHERTFGTGHFLRPGMIQLFGCAGVLLEDFAVVDSPFWSVHTVFSRNVTARGLRITSHNPNNDGVDPESSSDVLIERCTFDTGDDCIAIKSGRDQDGWRVGQPSEHIVVRDCDMRSLKAAICLGSEMSGGLRNIHVRNVRVSSAVTGIYFKTNLDRGGSIRHVRISGVPMQDTDYFIHFTTAYHSYRGGTYPPDVRDVVIENVRTARSKSGIRIVGAPAAPLRDISLRDVHVAGAAPHEVRHVQGFRTRDVTIGGAPLALPATIS